MSTRPTVRRRPTARRRPAVRRALTGCTVAVVTALAVTVTAPAASAADVETAREQVAQLGRDVEAAAAEYAQVEARLTSQRERAAAAEARASSQARLVSDMEAEAALAVETYKRGSVDPGLSLLASGGLDVLTSTSTLTLLTERRSLSLNDVREAQTELDRRRGQEKEQLAEVEALTTDLAERRADIEARLQGAQDLLAAAEAEEQARLAAEGARAQEQASRDARSNEDAAAVPSPAPGGSGRFIRPLQGAVRSPFGWRIHPVYGERRLHKGEDIPSPCGTPVMAAGDGTVVSATWDGSYGNIITVDHGDGTSTAYAHLEGFAVTSGPVSQGEVIAYVGTTGLSTGCHTHFEVREDGEPVDPRGYL
ncbi:M23 family metallopeptidase [Aquipuribacter hungaricus]|uniref:M23 family metallopeptidase n=1 Tax=Aquipuribacter hungaricus TaxID=545624 RepID=UPI00360978E8